MLALFKSLNEHFVEVRLYKVIWFMRETYSLIFRQWCVCTKFEVVEFDEGTQQKTGINKILPFLQPNYPQPS